MTNQNAALYSPPAATHLWSNAGSTEHGDFGGPGWQASGQSNPPSPLAGNEQDGGDQDGGWYQAGGWTHDGGASPAMSFDGFGPASGRFDDPRFGPAQGFAPQPTMVVSGFGPSTAAMTQTLVVGYGNNGGAPVAVVSVEYEIGGGSVGAMPGEGDPPTPPQGSDQADGATRCVGVAPFRTSLHHSSTSPDHCLYSPRATVLEQRSWRRDMRWLPLLEAM